MNIIKQRKCGFCNGTGKIDMASIDEEQDKEIYLKEIGMENYKVENAVIDYTKLGVSCSDHGILSFMIGLDYGGAGQGFGGLCLDTYDEVKKKRIPTELAAGLLLGIDELWGKDWEDLKGIPCRSYHTWGHIKAIGHLLKDKWLWFDENSLSFKVTKLEDIKGG